MVASVAFTLDSASIVANFWNHRMAQVWDVVAADAAVRVHGVPDPAQPPDAADHGRRLFASSIEAPSHRAGQRPDIADHI